MQLYLINMLFTIWSFLIAFFSLISIQKLLKNFPLILLTYYDIVP